MLCFLALAAVVACDDDPSGATPAPLTAAFSTPDDTIIGRQEAIRVVFNDSLDARSALDPSNFIVIDRCTGLRVPGALRLARDTVIFTPSRALQFLTPLDVRVQNIMTPEGGALAQPFTFTLVTEAPPVSDISWTSLNSPTNDPIGGVTFADRNLGWISTFGGAIYRTTNGGRDFAALFKDADIIQTGGIRVAGRDTLFMVAAPSFGGTTYTTYGLFRSIDGGRSFQPLFTESPADMSAPEIWKRAGANPVVLIGGNRGALSTWRYDSQTGQIDRFGPVAGEVGHRAGLSRDGANAAMTGEFSAAPGQLGTAVLYRSTTGGRTFQPVTLPAGGFALYDVSFQSNTIAYAVGARSTVYRLDAASGAVTALGAAAGLPQTDSTPTRLLTYHFTAVEFAPGGQVGWMVGFLLERTVGQPEVARGIIYQTQDGGQTWTRQAVQGARDNGLGFEILIDVFSLATDFSATAGLSGFLAARTVASNQAVGVCTFSNDPVPPTQQ